MRIGGIEAGGTKMVCAIGEVQTDKGQSGGQPEIIRSQSQSV